MGFCAEWDLFENRLGENSKNSLRSMKTDSERLEESQTKPGQELRLESLKEREMRGELRHTWRQIQRSLLKGKKKE